MAKQFSGAGHLNVPHSAQFGGDKAARGFTVGEGKKQRHIFPEHVPAAIARELALIERIKYDRPYQIFDYWLDVQLAYYHAQPLICAYIVKHKEFPSIDTQHWIDSRWPESHERLERIRNHYGDRKKEVFEHFWNAFDYMTRMAELQVVGDWLGGVFAEYELHNHYKGQFFTPWNLCSMMSNMLVGDIRGEIAQIMYNAVNAAHLNIDGFPWQMTSEDAPERIETLKWLFDTHPEQILPYVKPMRVLEPSAGSGAMLMAFLDTVEPWMFNYDLIRLHGIDIDPTCVRMTQAHLLLYGINGYEHITKAAMSGHIDIDDPEHIAHYETAFQAVLDHIECRNALEFTPAERAAWEAELARKKAVDAELAAQQEPQGTKAVPKVPRGKPKTQAVSVNLPVTASPEPPPVEQPTLAAEFEQLAKKPKEKKEPPVKLQKRDDFVVIERQSTMFDDM